jgi:predicted dehydrogenase
VKRESLDRRSFIGTVAGTAAYLLTEEIRAEQAPASTFSGSPVKFGVIGIGHWGREILTSLSRLPSAQVTAICDTYEPYLKKGTEIAPKAAGFLDYKKLIESPETEAIVLATPTHLHREIAVAALQAGKHLYCEAPLATTVEDTRAIYEAAKKSRSLFQSGLQGRSNELYQHVGKFVKTGVLGSTAQVTAQWNKKLSWKRAAPTDDRERELNWRLSSKTSSGLVGEIGIHQLDLINWFLKSAPLSVTGFGSTLSWKDGRDIADTIQIVFDYPGGLRTLLSMTLANSFSDSYTLFQGSNSSLLLREKRGWMIKEADSPLLGWEVYARKEPLHNETGIVMVADATKLLEAGKEPGKDGSAELTRDPLLAALENFTISIRNGQKPAAGALEGLIATIITIKANEAVLSGNRVSIPAELFSA